MKISKIKVTNYRCFEETELELDDGVTVVKGRNGSGKSTLLEACFFALYGANALGDETLDDIITKGERECEVELWFSHGGVQYHLYRQVVSTSSATSHRSCVLETPDGTIEGVTDVEEVIINLLRMDSEAFLNSAYIRQGDMNRLIEASADERQRMIDNLLQLGVLETYRERADHIRRGVQQVLNERKTLLEEKQSQLESLERDSLRDQSSNLARLIKETKEDIESGESERETLAERESELSREIQSHKQTLETLQDVRGRFSEIVENIETVETRRSNLSEEITVGREHVSTTLSQSETTIDQLPIEQIPTEPDDSIEELLTQESQALSQDQTADVDTDFLTANDALSLDAPDFQGFVDSLIESIEEATDRLSSGSDTEQISSELLSAVEDASRIGGEFKQETENWELAYSKTKDSLTGLHTSLTQFKHSLSQRQQNVRETIENKQEQLETLQQERSSLETELEEKETSLEKVQTEILDHQSRFDDDDVEIEFGEASSWKAELTSELEEVRSELSDMNAEMRSLEDQIEHSEQLLEEGHCPECGQDVTDAPEVDSLEQNKAELETLEGKCETLERKRDDIAEQLEKAEILQEVEMQVDSKTKRVESLESDVESLSERIARKKESIERLQEEIGDKQDWGEKLADKIESVENRVERVTRNIEQVKDDVASITELRVSISSLVKNIEEARNRIQSLTQTAERLSDQEELLQTHQSEKERLEGERDELESELGDVDTDKLHSKQEAVRERQKEVKEDLKSLKEKKDNLSKQLGTVNAKLQQARELENEIRELEGVVNGLGKVRNDVALIRDTYVELRADLRQQNIAYLENSLNELFDEVYLNDSYAHLELDGDYRATVHEKTGTEIEPSKLSGGEKTLFNLALRCAIYRLLCEGVEGSPPMPPLILDEPTAHLDSGHVSNINSLVDEMRSIGVEQILVISHDETVIDDADVEVTVSQKPGTNRSQVERKAPEQAASISLG